MLANGEAINDRLLLLETAEFSTTPEKMLDGLTRMEALTIRDYERSHRKRKTLMYRLYRKVHVTG